MNDNELDTMLREHGKTWRTDHGHRPGIDWDTVTEAKRRPTVSKAGLGVIAIAAAAAAVIVPLSVVGGSKPAAKPNPAHKPLPLKIAEKGAPDGFFAIAPPTISGPGGAFAFVQVAGTDSVHPGGHRAVAAATAPGALRGYAAYRTGSCASKISDLVYDPHYKGSGLVSSHDVASVPAQVARSAMAVSPDGKQLAFVEDRTINPTTGRCVSGPQRIGIMTIATKATTTFNTKSKDYVESLVWAPDNQHLAFELAPGPETSDLQVGAQVIDTHALGSVVLDGASGLTNPLQSEDDGMMAPLIYWRGQLAALVGGKLRLLTSDDKLGATVLSGLPKTAMSISADPTGQHLIIVAGPYTTDSLRSRGEISSGYSNEQEITTGTTYRWDNGRLSKVQDAWLDPAW